jgi:hypothetical protein
MKSKKKYEGHRPGGGTTNKEKERRKNFLMVRKSSVVQGKLKSSLKDQNRALKKRIRGDKVMDRRSKKRRRRA